MKKLLAALTVPGLVLGGAAVAGAQTTDDDTTTDDTTVESEGHKHGRRAHRGGMKFAEALGMTGEELREAVQAGETVAEIAAGQGIDINTVIADLVAEAQVKADENPDAPRAQNFDAEVLTERLTAAANGEFEPGEHGHRHGRRFGGGAIAESLGLEPSEIKAAIEAGSTIADIAADQGVDIDGVIDQIVAEAQARADENPDSPRAQNFDADEFEQRLTDRVNGDFEPGDRQGRRFGGPRGQGGAPDTSGVDA